MTVTLQTREATLSGQHQLDATRRPRSARVRDPFFDNAKILLVTAVVVGHAWVLLPATPFRQGLYEYLYLFHMPAFVLVTGYLSRSFTWSRRNLSRLVTSVVVPYVVFEGLMALFRTTVGGERLENLWVDPHWPMWFLAALVLWRLATPLLRAAPAPLAVAVAICLVGGLTTGDVLDTARVMGFLPFFVLGLTARPEHVRLLRQPRARLAAVGCLALAAALAPFWTDVVTAEWLYWRSGYAELGVGFVEGAALRLVLLTVGTVLALSALALVPTSRRWFSALGAASLVVYLCHGFFVKGAEYAGLEAVAAAYPVTAFVVVTVLATLVALALAAPPVARRLGVLVDPVNPTRLRRFLR